MRMALCNALAVCMGSAVLTATFSQEYGTPVKSATANLEHNGHHTSATHPTYALVAGDCYQSFGQVLLGGLLWGPSLISGRIARPQIEFAG